MPEVGAQNPVLVVGAGPTGLLLAAELERRDVSCLLIDALDAPRGWDRATVVHERSLEIFEALGIAERFIAEGVKTRGARFHSDGEVLAELNLSLTGSRYGFQLGISEEVTESALTDYLEAQGGAVTRSTRLVAVTPREDAVHATLERDGERQQVVAEWLVGCDGSHSVVREAAAIEFPGTRHPGAVGRLRRDHRGLERGVRPRLRPPRPAAADPHPAPAQTVARLRAADVRRERSRRRGRRGARPLHAREPPSPRSRARRGSTVIPGLRIVIGPAASCSPATPPTPAPRRRATG